MAVTPDTRIGPEPLDYVSTRGAAPTLRFGDVLLTGLAADGGLYLPQRWPALPEGWQDLAAKGYAELATEVMWPYVVGSIEHDRFAEIVADAYATFDTSEVTPLRDLGDDLWLLELFHGPTFAFKDVALQLVGRLFDEELGRRGERLTVLVATSGDTGSAAMEALRDRDAVDVVVLYPEGRVSDVQRRQMTTIDAPNVHAVAVEGNFDDCQDLVKAAFADEAFRSRVRLGAVNSINWARVMAQVVYYVYAAARLGGGPLSFSVPTGNFGNVLAGWVAQRAGLPVEQLIVASNRNDILYRFLTTGTMAMEQVTPTLSPSMDIQVSSNLERLLFEAMGHDGESLAVLMSRFREDRTISVELAGLPFVGETFSAARYDDEATKATIASVAARTGVVLDPHSAIGVAAAGDVRRRADLPMVALATAHPAKFGDAVTAATGSAPEMPARLAEVFDRPERTRTIAADLAAVEGVVDELRRA
ncbi:MAG: threonine synthase [Actinomycetota bacterium]|nr:threonine synthase [Actinomycetota bacterium]